MQDDSQTGRYPSVPPFYYSPVGDPGNYQLAHPQAQVPPKPSKHRPRKGKDHLPNANDFNQQQCTSFPPVSGAFPVLVTSSDTFSLNVDATEVQHEAAKRGSRSTAAAFPSVTNTNPFTGSSSGAGYDAAGQYASGLRKTRADGLRTPNRDSLGTQQQQYAGAMQHASRVEASIHVFGGQKAQSQTTPSGQFYPTAAESAQQGSSSNNPFHPAPPKKLNSKPKKDSGEEVKEKESDKGKGKKPQRATVETTDDEDDYPSPNHRLSARERNVQTTLGPVLESLISTDDDDDIGDILEAPPVRNLRPLSVPNTPSPQAVGNPNTASTANASKQQRPLSTPTIPISSPSQSTSVHHNARPAASAVATPLASTSGGATSAPAGKPLGPTPEEERLAQLAADFTRMSSSLSTKDGKKKKKGLFSKMNFLKKKEKHEGGVVGIISVDGD